MALLSPPPDFNRFIPPIEDRDPEPLKDPAQPESPIEELEDGSAVVTLGGQELAPPLEGTPEDPYPGFDDNLAEKIEETKLNAIAVTLLELVSRDKQTRQRRDEQYAEGIRRAGLNPLAKENPAFTSGSTAVHPMLAEGCVDFSARAVKELFPPAGPVRTQIIGEVTDAKLKRAERKRAYMNWQLTKQIPEYRAELERLLTQLPLGGSQYLKIWPDLRYRRPRVEFVPVDEILIPYAVSHFYSSHRVTHQQRLTRAQYEERTASGLYRETPVIEPGPLMDETASQKVSEKIEGKEDDAYNTDGLRTIYEIYIDFTLDKTDDRYAQGELSPYIITVDEFSHRVLAIYRNWDPKNQARQKLDWIVEWCFIPWRGAYGIGLAHLIGSLAAAGTGAIRALLDAAHINNFPGALRLGGTRMTGQNVSIEPGTVASVNAGGTVDDIRKLVMPLPYNPPSTVLFSLLEWITAQGKGVVGTAEERISNATNNTPVGTTLALIEQGSMTYSSIHARLHDSQAKALEILHRIDADLLDDEVTVEELGDLVVKREDFTGPMDVLPVSDPRIFSEAQRLAQLQAVMQLATVFPEQYRREKLNERFLQLIALPNYDEVLAAPPDPKELDPISENVLASTGAQPIKAYEHQDHLSHLQTHVHFMVSPVFGMNPVMAAPALPTLVAHCKEHLLMYYKQHALAASQAAQTMLWSFTGQTVTLEDAMVKGVALADQEMAKELAAIVPLFLQAAQMAQQVSQPPLPPEHQIKMQEVQLRAQQINNENELKKTQLQIETALEAQKQKFDEMQTYMQAQLAQRDSNLAAQVELLKAQIGVAAEQQKNELQNRLTLVMTDAENRTKLLIAEMNNNNTRFLEAVRMLQATQQNEPTQGTALTSELKKISDSIQQQQNLFLDHSSKLYSSMAGMHQSMQEMSKQVTAPRRGRLVYGPTGDVTDIISEPFTGDGK